MKDIKYPSDFFYFCEQLRGLILFNKKTGEEISKWEVFDFLTWESTAKEIKEGTHKKIACKAKPEISEKVINKLHSK